MDAPERPARAWIDLVKRPDAALESRRVLGGCRLFLRLPVRLLLMRRARIRPVEWVVSPRDVIERGGLLRLALRGLAALLRRDLFVETVDGE